MKDQTFIILAVVGVAAFLLYKKGFFSSSAAYSDKYTEYANALQGLANNATGNFLGVHSAISQGINDQINQSVGTAISSINNWAQMAQANRSQNDSREHDQFMQILNTI